MLPRNTGPFREPALDIRALRKRPKVTQRQFAGWFGFPVATLRHWERGNRRPSGTALVLLHVIAENPRAAGDRADDGSARPAGFRPPPAT